ncbi:MAG: Uma2 family endonuclease [Thermoanaerobaculia bacterium]
MVVQSGVVPEFYRATYRDWLDTPDDNAVRELIHGEIYVNPPPSVRHQRLSGRLFVALGQALGDRGEVFHAPLGVRLSDEDVPEPDLVVVLAEHRDRIGERVIEGPPDLVVEILSRGTAQRDLVSKCALYEAHALLDVSAKFALGARAR